MKQSAFLFATIAIAATLVTPHTVRAYGHDGSAAIGPAPIVPPSSATNTPVEATTVTSTVTTQPNNVSAPLFSEYMHSFYGRMASIEEVPAVSTIASGHAFFETSREENTMSYQLYVHKGTSITQAHLHCADRGKNGPIVTPLFTHTTGIDVDGLLVTGKITEQMITEDARLCSPNIYTMGHLIQAMREGHVYVNVHSTTYPDGEIRAQIIMKNAIAVPVPTTTSTVTVPTNGTQTGITSITGLDVRQIPSPFRDTSRFLITIENQAIQKIADILPNIIHMILSRLQ